jgi:hypothetical protein
MVNDIGQTIDQVSLVPKVWKLRALDSIKTPPNYLTSDDVGGPAYNWIDISGTGNRLNISN